jgi:hypothetical protein
MITRSDPFHEALSLRRAMDQLFEQSFVNPNMMPGLPSLTAPLDVCETPNGYEVDVALLGVRPEDIELTVDQNTLTIRGHYSHQNEHQNQPQSQTQTEHHDGGQPTQHPSPRRVECRTIDRATTGSRGKSSPARLSRRSPSPDLLIQTIFKRSSRMGCSRFCFPSVRRAARSDSLSQVPRVNCSRRPSGQGNNKGNNGPR